MHRRRDCGRSGFLWAIVVVSGRNKEKAEAFAAKLAAGHEAAGVAMDANSVSIFASRLIVAKKYGRVDIRQLRASTLNPDAGLY